MAKLENRMLFFTTSPRTPDKMIPEIKLLVENFNGMKWKKETQISYMKAMVECGFFLGKGSSGNMDFSARDRITRAPKALGFVSLKPTIELTDAGTAFIYGKRPQEIFLRQLLKFQLPSPYHREDDTIKGTFWVRPYLEIFRLIRDLEYLTLDEFKIFAVQLTDYREYTSVKNKILDFRQRKNENKGSYNKFVKAVWDEEIRLIFHEKIENGEIATRETTEKSLAKFMKTKRGNMRDYADACFRYLRYTGLVKMTRENRSISIFEGMIDDVDFFLEKMNRNPVYVNDATEYKKYLFCATVPELFSDNKENIEDRLLKRGNLSRSDLEEKTVEELKDLLDGIIEKDKNTLISNQVKNIKSYALYSDITDTFNELVVRGYYDAPLMLEYNAWRAMTMLDGGEIKGNFIFDDEGQPLSTAPGNQPDIECDYGTYALSVEVTMQSGQRQYESEGEPVARHYGKLKKKKNKDTYCLFIAPSINPATVAHFYVLNRTSIDYYGGKSKIIPIELDQFMRMIDHSYNLDRHCNPSDLQCLLDEIIGKAETTHSESEWKKKINEAVDSWLI